MFAADRRGAEVAAFFNFRKHGWVCADDASRHIVLQGYDLALPEAFQVEDLDIDGRLRRRELVVVPQLLERVV